MANVPHLVHRDVWRMAGPMILSNLSIPLLGLVDAAVMGHMDDAYYLGAVAIGGLIFSFIYWGFGFLRMGTTGITAQAFGRDDSAELRAILARGLLLALVFAVLLLLLHPLIRSFSLAVLDASTNVEHFAAVYFDIRIWSAPATLANYVLIGWFLGLQRAMGPLWLLLTVNVSNIILDLVFVLLLGMTVDGVALASVIAEYLGLLVGIFLIWRYLAQHKGTWRYKGIFDSTKISAMLIVNQHIFIRTLCLIFSFGFFTAQGAKYGDIILAANAVLMNFQTFMAYGLDGFAHAAEALVGKAVGRRNEAELKTVIRTCAVWSIGVAVMFMVAYGLGGELIIALITDLPEVQATALAFLPWLVIAPIISVWSYLYDGIFIGATRSKEMRDTMLVSTLLCYLPAWYMLQPFGNHGLWAALMVFMAARGISMAFSMRKMEKQGRFFA